MFNRRSFIQWSLATGLGLHSIANNLQPLYSPNEFERGLANCDDLNVLGRPRSWSLVREGFHPISPERVIVITEKEVDGWPGRYHHEGSLQETLTKPLNLSPVKLDRIFRLIEVMTNHYRSPHLLSSWAIGLARRESLGTTGFGQGFAYFHQFQDDGLVELTNPPVDWWLVLFPGGIEWEGFGQKPVFGMIGHVFPPHHLELPGFKLRVWELTFRTGVGIGRETGTDAWVRIASLDRTTAAQTVNRAIIGCGIR